MPPDTHAGKEDMLLSELYPQLRKMAAARMALQAPDHTLRPTELVHEAWIRLSAHAAPSGFGSARQLAAAAAKTMRHILVDYARQRARPKRGGDWKRVPIEAAESISTTGDEKLLFIHEMLCRLEKEDPLRARVVLLKFYGGLSNREVGREMDLTERTVERYWSHAKAWLYDEILLNQ